MHPRHRHRTVPYHPDTSSTQWMSSPRTTIVSAAMVGYYGRVRVVTSTLGSCSRCWTFSSRTRIFRVFRHFCPAGRDGVDGRPFFFSSVVNLFRVFRHFWPGKTRWGRWWLDVLFIFFSHHFFVSSRFFFHIISSFHPIFRLFSTVYDRTTVWTSNVIYVPYDIFQNFKFNMTYSTYMFMPDLQYAL